jgi:hypothetical protein
MAQTGFGVLDQLKYFATAREVSLAFWCQAEASGGAVQKARLQMSFKPLDEACDGRWRQAQGFRCAHKTPAFDHAKENLHCLYAIHILSQ